MKTTIWANCPKCQTELKIETDEPELVQIECPDCSKVFAAKVPPRSAAPLHDVFSQVHTPAPMPVLPPFQPAQVHYKSRPKSDEGMSPAVLTALIVVCASAILIPLGFGGYYFYSQLSESSQIAMSNAAPSKPATNVSSTTSFAATTSSESKEPTPSFKENSAQAPAGKKISPPSEAVGANSSTPAQPQLGPMTPADATTSPEADSQIFGVPELNPPMIPQSNPTSPQVTPPSNSNPMTTGPMTSSPTTSNPTNSNGPQGQVSVAGPGISKSGLPVQLHRFAGSNGVLIFVLHDQSVANGIQQLQRSLSIPDIHADSGTGYTTIGIRYTGSVDSVVKDIRFGQVTFVDEESRSIHVKAN